MPLQAFIMSGIPPRLMAAMELHTKNTPKRFKEPLYPEPSDATEREERLATVWMAFFADAGISVNSCWTQSLNLSEIWCNLPTSSDEWRRKVGASPVERDIG